VSILTSPALFRRAALSLLVCSIAAGSLLALGAGRAEAHGVQVASDPAPNAQLAETPELITISFSEPIEPSVSSIQLWDQSAQPVALGELVFGDDPKQMGVRVPGDLPSGIYTVVWRNLSTVDGHTWAGSYAFIMLGPGGALPSGEVSSALEDIVRAPSSRPATLESAARWVVLLGSAVMLGGAAYVLFVAFPAARVLGDETAAKLRQLSLTVLLVTSALGIFFVLDGSLLQLMIQADRLGGIGEADDLLIDTRFGHYLAARQGLLLVALLAVVAAWRSERGRGVVPAVGVLLVSSFGVLLTQSLVSHSAASHGPFWTTAIDLLHLFAASLWIGMLVHIGLAMPRWLDELSGAGRTLFAADSFRRFSGVAAASVVVLLASGVLSALVQVTSFEDLWETTYGRSLLGKLGAMLPLLGVAGLNAFRLRPRVIAAAQHLAGGAGDESDAAAPIARLQRLLANTIRAEAALGIAVLVSVAVLIQLQPPRAGAEAAAQSAGPLIPAPSDTEGGDVFRESAEVEGLILSLVIDPARVGQNSFELGMGAEFGGIGEVLDVRLDFTPPNADVGGSRLPLALAGSAKYTAEGANLSLPGEWTVLANVRRRGLDDVRATFAVPVLAAGPDSATQPGAATDGGSDSIWDWPFEGGRSVAAIAVLAVVGVGGAGYGALRTARRRA